MITCGPEHKISCVVPLVLMVAAPLLCLAVFAGAYILFAGGFRLP